MSSHRCTMCTNPTENVGCLDGVIQPDNGLHILIRTGYGMFIDPMEASAIEVLDNIVLCHECSVKFVRMFPEQFQKELFHGGHHGGDGSPCCEFSWQ